MVVTATTTKKMENKELYWLRNFIYIIIGFAILWFYITVHMLMIGKRIALFYYLWIIICFIIYWLAYIVILKRNLFAIPTFENKPEKEEKNLLSDKADIHYQKLLSLLQTEKLYQDAQLNMDILSQKMGLSNGYLSKIINQKEGKNFYEFINSYRIEAVKANLNNPDYSHYSILGIGLEAGFKSKSTFNSVFKKMTGMTPSAFKKGLG